ncbi:unnamed protein product [Callosobruchus maculatus]|uniref:Uncharacterized protein n=1 Tax=Callosobruchus maculatus TaxID=64391 RepID=A0A653DHH8_CALMS|nr:unnamed protein product [Callosobruchus maculatus]
MESSENLTTSQTSLSFPVSLSKNSLSPNVSPTQVYDRSAEDLLNTETKNTSEGLSTDNLSLDPDGWHEERPNSVNLIDFSPVEPKVVETGEAPSPSRLSNNDKRKSDETEPLDENAIYQQVKYFRRSIHEVNALLDLENEPAANEKPRSDDKHDYEYIEIRTSEENTEETNEPKTELLEENYDSLEPESNHIYENVDANSVPNEESDGAYEKVEMSQHKTEALDLKEKGDKIDDVALCAVDDTKNDSEETLEPVNNVCVPSEKPVLPLDVRSVDSSLTDSTNNSSPRFKKFYERDSLPPCLRARNLKNQLKTRSLDEDEFEKEFNNRGANNRRRISFDENAPGFKTNSLPKMLNQPKSLPAIDGKLESLHLAHSTENMGVLTEEEEQKKRERIEKYKEERRKILQDKYRSESFKEDKEVLLTRLRIYKPKDDTADQPSATPGGDNRDAGRNRRRSTRSESSTESINAPEPPKRTEVVPPAVVEAAKETPPPITEEQPIGKPIRTRAAIFEQNVQKFQPPAGLPVNHRSSLRDHTRTVQNKIYER